jgi:hypothetical protein
MIKKVMVAAILLSGIFLAVRPGATLSGNLIVELKKAGVSDRTIQIIVEEKVIETAAFSVDDIVNMKHAGLREETLQMLIRESSFLKKSEPIIYGRHTKSLRFTSVQDVIELKKAGLSDEVIQAVIAVSGERYYSQREEAFDLLRGMDIVVDTRGNRRDRKGQH